jgi:hypothetical protein
VALGLAYKDAASGAAPQSIAKPASLVSPLGVVAGGDGQSLPAISARERLRIV